MASPPSNTRIIVGLSGGVDSSVAALLLKQQGYRVEGLFMKNWEEDDTDAHCSAAEDLADAEAVCRILDIPLHTVNFSAEYWDRVFAYFLKEYEAGRTPNPDVLCNKEIKFRAFLDHARTLGADCIATGHYARIAREQDGCRLLRGADPDKDQTYFLYTLNQEQLGHSRMPVGELQKNDVRALAREHGLPTHAKKDSTGICFIGERNFRQFLERYLDTRPGPMETPDGDIVGRHQGLMFYTLGQRQGLGLGGRPGAGGEPWYVVDKLPERNVLVVAQGHDHPRLLKHTLVATDLHWVGGDAPALPLACTAKTRYRQTDQPCTVHEEIAGHVRVQFAEPQWAMTPGQAVVFYDRNTCLGGGTIARVR